MFKEVFSYATRIYFLTLFSSGLSFVVTMYMAKVIEKSHIGKYAFYVTIYSLLGTTITAGIDKTFIRFLGEKTESYANLIQLYVQITIYCLLIFLAVGLLLMPYLSHEVSLGVIATGPFICTQLSVIIFRGRLERANEIRLMMGISLLNSSLTFVFLSFSKNEWAPIGADFLSLLIPSIVAVCVILRRIDSLKYLKYIFNPKPSPLLREFVTFAKPLWLAGVAFSFHSQQSSILIKTFLNYKSLGDFYFAKQLLLLIHKPVDVLSKVLLAAFSLKNNVSFENFKRTISIKLAIFPVLAILVLTFLPYMIDLFDLASYKNSSTYVRLFVLALPFVCIQSVVSIVHIVSNNPRVNRNSYFITSMIMIPVGALLVYFFGVKGAAVSPSLYAFVLFISQVYYLKKTHKEFFDISVKYGLVAQVLYTCMLIAGAYFGNIFTVWGFIVVYFAFGHLLRLWDIHNIYCFCRYGSNKIAKH